MALHNFHSCSSEKNVGIDKMVPSGNGRIYQFLTVFAVTTLLRFRSLILPLKLFVSFKLVIYYMPRVMQITSIAYSGLSRMKFSNNISHYNCNNA